MAGWLSAAVENVSLRRTGIVVLRSTMRVITPPCVSTPRDRGLTSSSRTSETSGRPSPVPGGGALGWVGASGGSHDVSHGRDGGVPA